VKDHSLRWGEDTWEQAEREQSKPKRWGVLKKVPNQKSLFHREAMEVENAQAKRLSQRKKSPSIRSSKKCFTNRVKRETVDSFLGFQEIRLVQRKMQYPVVERRSRGKLAQYVIPRVSMSEKGITQCCYRHSLVRIG